MYFEALKLKKISVRVSSTRCNKKRERERERESWSGN